MKKTILFLIISLLVIPLVYAGDYGDLRYSVGVYGVGEVVSPPPITPSGGGRAPTCTYDWQCTNWFPAECPESEIQERICANRGTCTGTLGMPSQIRICTYEGPTEPLFDIFLTLPRTEICAGREIKANIKLENYGKVELLDAFMTYWILNQNNSLIAELKDTRAVEERIDFNVEIKIPKLTPKGTYRLYAQITYAENKTAVAGESFEILSESDCKISILQFISKNKIYFICGGSGIIIILFVLILIKLCKFILKRKKKKKKAKGSLQNYKKRIRKKIEKHKNKNTV